ncbi:MAG: polyketide cyclase [Rhodospirillales bacterium]|nr:polyketide cyclase [Rhodospirillales bacterium]
MVMAAKTEAPAETGDELTITRVLDAPRELVFKAWTDPNHALHWWGPKEWPAVHLEMDVRLGGAWRMCLRSPDTGGELWQGGVFRQIAPPGRLSFTFAWEEEGERGLPTLVTVNFADEDGKTRMEFRQTPFQSAVERDGHRYGWNSTFDRLADYLGQA